MIVFPAFNALAVWCAVLILRGMQEHRFVQA
jgi:hypothetical protein